MTASLVVDPGDSAIQASFLAEIHDPEAGCAVVVADPDRKVLTILQDILLGVGPDRDGLGWPADTESARAWVRCWLYGRRIRDLVVAHADALTTEQRNELVDLPSQETRIWLLARTSMKAIPGAERVSIESFIAHFELQRTDRVALPNRLSGFPKVPLDGILLFRERCHKLLTGEEFWLVDDLLYRSAAEANRRLQDIEPTAAGTWDLVEPVLTLDYPPDAIITALRGYQLAAFTRGIDLAFNARVLYPQLTARKTYDRSGALLMMADTNPAAAVMLIAESLGASTEELSELTLDALTPDGRSIRLSDGTAIVPLEVSPVLVTHFQARIAALNGGALDTARLFVHEKDPSQGLSASALKARLSRASVRLGAARTSAKPVATHQFKLTPFEWADPRQGR